MTNAIAKDFVFMGIRLGGSDKKVVKIGILNEQREIVETNLYSYSRGNDRIVGQIYTGATFEEGSVRGLAKALWAGAWPVQSDIIKWSAEETKAVSDYKKGQREKLAGKSDPIDAIMLPLRKEWESMRNRGDITGCYALEHAVALALRRKVRKDEECTKLKR